MTLMLDKFESDQIKKLFQQQQQKHQQQQQQ